MPRLAGSGTHYRVALLDGEGNATQHSWAFPSVTSVIDAVIAKPRLQHWYYRKTVDGFGELLKKYGAAIPTDPDSIKQLLKKEKLSPYAYRDAMGAKGTEVHEDLEKLCAGKKVEINEANEGLIAWWDARELQPEDILFSEVPLVSFDYGYAGTCDLVYRDPRTNVVVLADLKTSAYVQWTHFLQVQAYAQALEENHGVIPDQCSIIQVRPVGTDDKELPDGWQEVTDSEVDFEMFRAALEIYYSLPVDWMPEEME